MGRVSEFLGNEGSPWSDEFGNAEPGSREFSSIWKDVAKREPNQFNAAQHSYIKRTHYNTMVNNINKSLNLNLEERSSVLKDVIWSTAVQHGPDNHIFQRALKGVNLNNLSDAEVIKAVYAERGKINKYGNLTYFSNSSIGMQNSIKQRFKHEMNDALKMLKN